MKIYKKYLAELSPQPFPSKQNKKSKVTTLLQSKIITNLSIIKSDASRILCQGGQVDTHYAISQGCHHRYTEGAYGPLVT